MNLVERLLDSGAVLKSNIKEVVEIDEYRIEAEKLGFEVLVSN